MEACTACMRTLSLAARHDAIDDNAPAPDGRTARYYASEEELLLELAERGWRQWRDKAAEPEALFASAERLADRASRAGVPVTFSPVADSAHSFVLFDFLPETDRALTELATFAYVVGAR